jgi:hypothetical protein
MDASWQHVAADFEPDGSLRDIYVRSATLTDWDRTIVMLRRDYSPLTFTRDGEPFAPPQSASAIFSERDKASIALDFEVGGIELACHFFTQNEIEFDLPPEQVNSSERFSALQHFLRVLAATVGKIVVLSPESAPTLPILVVDPSGTAVFNPTPDAPAT